MQNRAGFIYHTLKFVVVGVQMNERRYLKQQERLFILFGYLLILCSLSFSLFGLNLPPRPKNIWLLSGFAGLLFGTQLLTPFFTPPADVISYAFTALVVLITSGLKQISSGPISLIWLSLLSYNLLLLFISSFSILIKDREEKNWQFWSKLTFRVNSWLGEPKIIFTLLVFYSVFAFHLESLVETVSILLTWVIILFLEPLENLYLFFLDYKEKFLKGLAMQIGETIRHETPNIVLINDKEGNNIKYGDLVIARTENGKLGVAMAIDHMGFEGGRWLRARHLEVPPQWIKEYFRGHENIQKSEVYKVDPDSNLLSEIREKGIDLIEKKDEIVGLVHKRSNTSKLRIKVSSADIELEEGQLLETKIHGEKVLYQVINGVTSNENFKNKNIQKHIIAEAKKIGRWDEANNGFNSQRWLPEPNQPVFKASDLDNINQDDIPIGYFPKSPYPVFIESIDKLVTHNTAILGILGVGKTYLSLELVERMLKQNIKVLALDITGEYKDKLSNYRYDNLEQLIMDELNAVGEEGENNYEEIEREGGSKLDFKTKLEKILTEFLSREQTEFHLLVLDPNKITVWEQTGGKRPDSNGEEGKADMDTLSPAQITRIISEITQKVLQEQGQSEEARCCIVYEEAHSLIPEFRSTANEGDSKASSGTAKAIMQGRKYGLGSLVITQRTANVRKSVLNQCNSIFAMRVYDATGMGFLENYIGEDYVSSLPELDDQQAIIFGKASSCDDPIRIDLNDRSVFKESIEGFGTANYADIIETWDEGIFEKISIESYVNREDVQEDQPQSIENGDNVETQNYEEQSGDSDEEIPF